MLEYVSAADSWAVLNEASKISPKSSFTDTEWSSIELETLVERLIHSAGVESKTFSIGPSWLCLGNLAGISGYNLSKRPLSMRSSFFLHLLYTL